MIFDILSCMDRRHRLDVVSKALATDGVLSVKQAHDHGLSQSQVQRLVETGLFERPARGVLRLSGSESTFKQALRIAVLRVGEPVMVSHGAAAFVWELDGFERPKIELTVPRRNQVQLTSAIIHRTQRWRGSDARRKAGLLITTPERTLIDVAYQVGEDRLEIALDDALRRRLTTTARLERLCGELQGRGFRGPGRMAELMNRRHDIDGQTDSTFETLLMRELRKRKLAVPVIQHRIVEPNGEFIMRTDFAYPSKMIAIEADSERWHMNRAKFNSDRYKRAKAESIGWRVLAFTFSQLKQSPEVVVAIIERALTHGTRTILL